MKRHHRLLPLAARAAVFALVLPIIACSESAPPAPPPPPQVSVAPPVKRTVTDFDDYVGRFVAVDSVEVRARVPGYLEQIHFVDGQFVKQGDLLFTIDKRPFQNARDQAVANLEQARANLAFAEADLARGAQLVREKTITDQTFELRQQAKRTSAATVAANEALLRQAELDLQFTELRAPVAGRIGDRRVSVGNLVAGGTAGTSTLLATIVSLDPIRFEFTFDEASYLRYERTFNNQTNANGAGEGLQVKLKLIDEQDFTHEGRIDFVDNVIDRTSGTIRGRALLKNPNGIFTPGMFARIQMPASPPYEALLVPDTAIGSEQVRKFVYVVGTDNVPQQKYVTLGQLVDRKLRVIKDGLAPDDRVVVNGLMRIRPGQKVTPVEAPPASAMNTN